MQRKVTEQDLRMPEFRDAKVEDLEFRDDGKIVRKDRWERGMFSIAYAMGFNSREGFEITDVVAAIKGMVDDSDSWCSAIHTDLEDWPPCETPLELRLKNGSVLRDATRCKDPDYLRFLFMGSIIEGPIVFEWREQQTKEAGK